MKKLILLTGLILSATICFGQIAPKYSELISEAESFYLTGNYAASAKAYSDAFKANGWLGQIVDRYNAACAWALSGNADSSFFNLHRIIDKGFYTDYEEMKADSDLFSLHADVRWEPLLNRAKANKEKEEALLNKPIAAQLDSIQTNDQKYRVLLDDYTARYGRNSPEMEQLMNNMRQTDSINVIMVTAILDKYGWQGSETFGRKGSSALFLVIQHADLKIQEKYYPMMKEAVKNGKARPDDLALLTDRIEMRNNRPQIYGSQVTMKDGKHVFYEIIDEANVNKRRAEVGLQPLEEYAKLFGIQYSVPAK